MTFYRNLFAIPILLILIKKDKVDLKIEKCPIKNIAAASIIGAAATVLLYSSYYYPTTIEKI